MTRTLRNFTGPRVAGRDPGGAKAWLARQRAWEDRLRELERRNRSLERRPAEPETPVRVVVRQRADR